MPTVALILKAPREGQVKTRLAFSLGDKEATRVYRRLVEHQIKEIPSEWKTEIHFTPADAATEMQSWLGPGHSYSVQSDGDLGDRLEHAMRVHFAEGNEPLIFLGADCPYLTRFHLAEVGTLLSRTEVVMVPAIDGGYCLLALRRLAKRIFHSIAWNRDSVAEETRHRMREEQIAWTELPPLEDVDDEASWMRAKLSFPELDRSASGN